MLKNNQKDLIVNREEASTNSYDITVSSENAEPWTFVTDIKEKQNESPAPNKNIKKLPEEKSVNDEENRVEIIEDNGNQAKLNVKDVDSKKSEKNTRTKEEEEEEEHEDDVSDGISIISECESIEAHTTRLENVPHCNYNYYSLANNKDNISDSVTAAQYTLRTPTVLHLQQNEDNQILRQRHRNPSTSSTSGETALQSKSSAAIVVDSSNIILVLKRKLKFFFYTIVFLAILGIIGKLYYPVWQNNSQDTSLEQKLNDISLQNNLMRAEIDILNKQVKYLTTFTDQRQHKHADSSKYKRNINPSKNEHHFKAWQGIGDNIQPVEISKSDLRRPYKCPDGSFVEFAGMCIEHRHDEPSISQQFAHVVDDLKRESEAWQTFEKVANHLHEFQEKPFETIDKLRNEYGTSDFTSPKPISDPHKHPEMPEYRYGDIHFDDDYRNYLINKDLRKEIQKEEIKSSINHPNGKSTPQYDNENFKERKKYKKNDREWNNKVYNYKHDKEYEYDSKEFHNKDKSKNKNKDKDKNKYHVNNDGVWQENYMKNREEARSRNEHKLQDSNWYIQRGQDREHKRYFDD